jgi:hypothetical protein
MRPAARAEHAQGEGPRKLAAVLRCMLADGTSFLVETAPDRKSGSQWTRRWRELDSNLRSLSRKRGSRTGQLETEADY